MTDLLEKDSPCGGIKYQVLENLAVEESLTGKRLDASGGQRK
jgi:hypothetical protein